MEMIADLFNHPIVVIISGLLLVWSLLTLILTIWAVARGIAPVLWRLGNGLSNRKIAVFAEIQFDDLVAMLVDSQLFQKSNIVKITKASMQKAKAYDMFLMHWEPFAAEIDTILNMKLDSTSLIIYAQPGEIEPPMMAKIGQHRNAIVVNFRGRLMNDILVSMITSGYKLK